MDNEEEILYECAQDLKEYCSRHDVFCKGCIFHRAVYFNGVMVSGVCILRETDPDEWEV